MKCPIDQTEMEKGHLAAHGNMWQRGESKFWMFWQKVEKVLAYKCPKCGKVELKVKENK